MASASNTEPSLVKKKFSTSDPSLPLSHNLLSETTCSRDTPLPSSSYARPASPNSSHSTPLALKHSAIESLDDHLKKLLINKLAYNLVRGRPSDTIRYHRMKLLEEVERWLDAGVEDTYRSDYRDSLMNLLASTSRQNVKNIPLDQSEWFKLLNQWTRSNSVEDIVDSREIHKILGVDGLRGFGPKDFKFYLGNILLPLRTQYRLHLQGVRAMYEFFDRDCTISSLPGTISACVILLTLLQLYASNLEFWDSQIQLQIQETKDWVEGILHKHSNYYQDLNNVDEGVLTILGDVYLRQFMDNDSWKDVAEEVLVKFKLHPQ